MGNSRHAPTNVPFPPSTISDAELLRYLTTVATWINRQPRLSLTSYTGGPNSHVSGAPGDLLVNIVTSTQTARLYIKEQGSSNTGWVSVKTQ